MSSNGIGGGGRGPLSLWMWAIVAAVLAAAAYLVGAELAQRWMAPALALPSATETPDPEPKQIAVAAAWLASGNPVEGTLGTEAGDEWQFRGRAGQSATVEMWLHPGSGSSVEAELVIHLIAPDETVLASETGSVFLVPYLVEPRLPATGLYRVQVIPVSGAPGRYSLALTLADGSAPITPGAPATPQSTAAASGDFVATVARGLFQWPTTRREISGWTFHDPRNPGHIGLDIAAKMWDPIVAVADGVVTFAEWGGGYGNLVIVEHDGDWLSYYAHLTEIVVEVGQEVRQGELLGGAGTTGYSTGPHLHFELRYNSRPVDPHVHLP
jgi:murein DD-endopeptidase MepM/ murein hydrolase activator NlpD